VRTWFTSDAHFGHTNIITYCDRPFPSVEAMRDDLVRRWNERVADGDRVLVLGDFALGRIDHSLRVLEQLNGTKDLLVGNHDWPFASAPEVRSQWTARYLEAGFRSVTNGTVSYALQGRYPVLLGHFPYAGDSHDGDRYADLRPFDAGLPILHGHVHTAWRLNGRQFNVGVDVNGYAPVSEDEIVDLLTDSGVLAGTAVPASS
jgi:calcineurin-like phosphoesterase family protein